MVSFWLKRVVVFFALSSVFLLLSPPSANAAGESYRWMTYDTITAAGGSFEALAGQSNEPAVYFTQDTDNPRVYKVGGLPDCEGTIQLTISNISTRGRVSIDGDCTVFKDYDVSPVIQRMSDAIDSIEREVRVLEKLHTDKECGGSNLDGNSCRAGAEATQATHVAQCKSTHNYEADPTLGNTYLDCLATALEVERPTDEAEEEIDEAVGSTCTLPDPGWALCQLIEITAVLTDNTFGLLQPFLEVEPLTQQLGARPGETSAYTAWQSLRDIANVTLVLAFFFIIYSHLTSVGLRTYDVKKAFPRLIVTALLINISFYVAGAAIDLSNIFGRSIQSVTNEFGKTVISESSTYASWSSVASRVTRITPTDREFTEENVSHLTNSEREEIGLPPKEQKAASTGSAATTGALTGSSQEEEDPIPTVMIMNGIVISGTMVLFANLSILIPLMVVALFSMFVTLMVLLLRQAVVIILVVLAPLAAAAFIFPGTKQYFDKWKSTFLQLLMLYPILSLIYASSVIASTVIRESALNNGQTLLAIFSMGIMVIPLIVTPLILKFGGGILAQFGGVVQGAVSKARGAALSSAKGYRTYRKNLRQARNANGHVAFGRTPKWAKGKWGRRLGKLGSARLSNIGAAVRFGQEQKAANAARAVEEYRAKNAGNSLSGIRDEELRKDLTSTLLMNLGDVDLKNVQADAAVLSTTHTHEALGQRARTGLDENGAQLSEQERRASQMAFMNTATLKEVHELIEQSHTMNVKQRADLVNLIRKNGFAGQAPHLSAGVLNSIIEGAPDSNNVTKMIIEGANAGRFSAGERLSGAGDDTLRRLQASMQGNQINPARVREIINQAQSEVSSGQTNADPSSIVAQISRMQTS